MITHLAAFLGLSAVVIATPGPDTAITVRNALFSGRRAGLATAAGVWTGLATWALFTAAGIAALLRESQPAFTAIRIAGGLYLVYLGVHALLGALRSHGSGRGFSVQQTRRVSPLSAYRQGLFSNLGNPKIAVFFIGLLPQFTTHGASFATLLLLGAIFCTMTIVWLSAYVLAIAKAGDFLRRERVRRWLDGASGVILVALGLRLVIEG